jgi:hypothetical protein
MNLIIIVKDKTNNCHYQDPFTFTNHQFDLIVKYVLASFNHFVILIIKFNLHIDPK